MYCEGLSIQEVCSSGKEREDNKKGMESGKPKGGDEGIRDSSSLALLSLLTALLCVGSSKLLQLLLNELSPSNTSTPHYALPQIMPDTSSISY